MARTGQRRLASRIPAVDKRHLEIQEENDENQCLERLKERHNRADDLEKKDVVVE